MKQFEIGDGKEIEQQLNRLGFFDFKDILKNAKECRIDLQYGVKTLELRAFDIDPREQEIIHYSFFFGMAPEETKWHIEQITASVIMDTIRNKEQSLIVEKSFFYTEDPLATKDQISREVLEMVKVEKHKEELLERAAMLKTAIGTKSSGRGLHR